MVARGWGGGGLGSLCLMVTEFQLSKIKTEQMVVMVAQLKCTLKMVKIISVIFCIFYHSKTHTHILSE